MERSLLEHSLQDKLILLSSISDNLSEIEMEVDTVHMIAEYS